MQGNLEDMLPDRATARLLGMIRECRVALCEPVKEGVRVKENRLYHKEINRRSLKIQKRMKKDTELHVTSACDLSM